MKFDLEYPLNEKNDAVSVLFDVESDHMPSLFSFKSTDVRFSIRHYSFTLISQAQFSSNIDRFTAYLAVNYIDRFLSKQVVLENKPWIVRILVMASLSLAAKMRKINLSLSHIINPISDSNRDEDEGLIFDLQSVNRMESLLLTTLNWRLRSITPFAFLQFFNLLFELSDASLSQSLEDRASDIIFSSHYEIKLLEYKPSTLAASAFLCAAHELIPHQVSFFLDAIKSKCQHIYKEELLNCWTVIREITVNEVSSSSLTPNSVLDHQERRSPQSEINPNTNNSSKRRRLNDLNDFRNDQTFHISQVQHC
ncbi:putative cyclin-D6-1 [Lycium ferocissimum]|uniref:putative cyclin-D6-1 n=1 Tax=Lycium ferocissimum TaxID=112874 RepID=UPI002815F063|nr:putative cyclin-D6-1 [Lycium ferocissimum]